MLFVCATAGAEFGVDAGHVKTRLGLQSLPADSVAAARIDDPAFDQGADLRLRFSGRGARWGLQADYQLVGQWGDSLAAPGAALPGQGSLATALAMDDDRRALDLTVFFERSDDQVIYHRLDRLHAEWREQDWVARIGRQAVSWGNGLVYTPMDVFNPFDPAAVDTEYKPGDDMVYAQFLRQSGEDVQLAWVVRRDGDGELDRDVNSLALKYHGFAGDTEYDLLVAEHYDALLLGIGGSLPWGGAVLRADVTWTDDGDTLSAVAGWSWSWVGWGKNMSGVLEYYYNGFGIDDEDYRPSQLLQNEALARRLARGELFTLARHYLAASLLVEVTPLVHVTPNLFLNLRDSSFLAQIVGRVDLAQDWRLLLSVNLPGGGADTEYGGFDSEVPGLEFSAGPAAFAQLAWYF